MSFEFDIIAFLKADAGLTSLCGGRISPEEAEQDPPYPLITWSNLYGDYDASMSGPTDMARDDLRFTVFATTKDETLAIRDRLIAVLHGARDNSVGPGETVLQGCFFSPAASAYDPVMKLHYIELDFQFYHA